MTSGKLFTLPNLAPEFLVGVPCPTPLISSERVRLTGFINIVAVET